ncbi:MAG: hypothetical protein Q9174_001052 [Haloplaca sp. 1 TL-2023]
MWRNFQYRIDLEQMVATLAELERGADMLVQSNLGERAQVEAQQNRLSVAHSSFQITPYSSSNVRSTIAESDKAASVKSPVVQTTAAGSVSNKSPVKVPTATSCPSTPSSSLFSIKEGQESCLGSTSTSADGSKPSSPVALRVSQLEENRTEDSTQDRVRCPTCKGLFKGNLKRHRHVHNGQPLRECPVDGCFSRCTRPDNLLKHMRLKHGIDSNGKSRKRKLEE